MKTLAFAIILVALQISTQAQAQTYHRFWRGDKLDRIDLNTFVQDLNQVFFSATVDTAGGKGLLAYEPVVTSGYQELPDEIALVSYESLDAYNALYATDKGKAYQALHAQYFDMTKSHSMVPVPYSGTLAMNQAYDLNPNYADWRTNTTTVLVKYRRSVETDAGYLARMNQEIQSDIASDPGNSIVNRAILVDPNYVVEYLSSSTSTIGELEMSSEVKIQLDTGTAAEADVQVGSGLNLQF